MTDTAAAQLRRILHVIPVLADDEEHPIAEVAERVGVDADTVRRDLWSLVTRFQEPAGFVEGVQVYIESDRVSVTSNHFRRPMRLTAPELCALELGLAMLRRERPPEEHRAIDRARERLRAVITKLPADPLRAEGYEASIGAQVDVVHLSKIRTALRSRRKLRLTYRRGDADRSTERVIAPYALLAASGMFYIVAYCDQSKGIRIFRLDRVEGVEATSERFEIPPDFSLDDVLYDGKALHAEQLRTVRVRYSPRIARWIAEREGAALDADGSLTIEHPLADLSWAVRHVLQYGPEAEVLGPEEVRKGVEARLRGMMGEGVGG
jgi:proteasome accessory factor C